MRKRLSYATLAAVTAVAALVPVTTASAAPCKDAIDCTDMVVCIVGTKAGLQCTD